MIVVHAFDVLGDPVRRRILELLANGELTSGAVTAVVRAEFGISQPAVSQHLKVLRESGFATVRPAGTRRLYAVDAAPFGELDGWLDHFRGFWDQRLDSLETELARGKRERRLRAAATDSPNGTTREKETTR
jgi:DNA-binding transcriptional ArsR family regulator